MVTFVSDCVIVQSDVKPIKSYRVIRNSDTKFSSFFMNSELEMKREINEIDK
jgi:hypothetical protein